MSEALVDESPTRGVKNERAAAKTKNPNIITDEKLDTLVRRLRGAAYDTSGVNWRKLFRYYDRDNSGLINFEEFKSAIRKDAKIGKEILSDKALHSLFDQIDTDGDGTMDYLNEFLPWVAPEGGEQDLPDSPERNTGYFAMMRTLERERQEVEMLNLCKQRLRAAAFDHLDGFVNWLKLFKKYDRDDSGEIEFHEFRMAIRKDAKINKNTLDDAQLLMLFKSVDLDGDGRVDYESEFLPWLKPPEEDPEWKTKRTKARDAGGTPTMVSALAKKEEADLLRKINLIKQRMRAAAYDKGGVNWSKLFQQYDRDASGDMDYEEFAHATRKLARVGKDQINDTELKNIFKIVATAKGSSGKLQYQEELLPWLEAGVDTETPRAGKPNLESRFFVNDSSPAERPKLAKQRSRTKRDTLDDKISKLISMLERQNDEWNRMYDELHQEMYLLRGEQESLQQCLADAGVVSAKRFQVELNKGDTKTRSLRGEKKQNRLMIPGLLTPTRLSGDSSSTPSRASGSAGASAIVRSISVPSIQRLEQPGVVDLFSMSKPLLTKGHGPTWRQQKAKALADIDAYLDRQSPDVWSGPDTPLQGALEADSFDLFQKLLAKRADPNICDTRRVPILHRVCFEGKVDMVCELLHHKADPNQTDTHNQTAFFFTPIRNVCQTLYDANGDTNVINKNGQSALHLAGRAGLPEILLWLTGKVPRVLLDMKDSFGFTAQDYARRSHVPEKFLRRLHPWEPALMGRQDKKAEDLIEEEFLPHEDETPLVVLDKSNAMTNDDMQRILQIDVGTVLLCNADEEGYYIYASPESDECIGTVPSGEKVQAAGKPVDVDGYLMAPIRYKGIEGAIQLGLLQ